MAGISAAYLAGIAALAAAGPATGVLYAAGPASLAAALMSLLLFCRKAGGPAPVYAAFFFLGIFTFCSRELCGAIVWQRPEAAQTAFELLKAAIADSGLDNGALVTALLVWSYLFQHRSVSMMHSLPIRREGLFVTNVLSGLTMMAMPERKLVTNSPSRRMGRLCIMLTERCWNR